MKLFYYPLSTYCQKVLLAFYEKDLSFSPEIIDMMNEQSRAHYEGTYAIGRVPLLQLQHSDKGELEDNHIIPESSIIIEYLDQQYPDTVQLIPESPDKARAVRFMDRMADLYLNDPISGLIRKKMFAGAEKEMPEKKAFKYIDASFEYLDKHLEERHFICGEDFTMADCAVIPALFYARYVYPFAEHENIRAYWLRVSERDSVKKMLNEIQEQWQPIADEAFADVNIVD